MGKASDPNHNVVHSEVQEDTLSKGDIEEYYLDTQEIPFEVSLKYAKLERELEQHEYDEKNGGSSLPPSRVQDLVHHLGLEDELRAGNRALRTTGWFKLFSLIMTDVMGPQSTPWTVAQLGYVPGIILYLVFGVLAYYTAMLMSRMYLHLSSSRFPLTTFSDLPSRVVGGYWGRILRVLIFVMQTIQFIFFVSGPILTNAQSISQIAQGKGCYVVYMVVVSVVCLIVNQIRSLHQLGRITIFNVVINLFVLFAAMGVMAHSPPNYSAAAGLNTMDVSDKTVYTYAVSPSTFASKLVAVSNICYAYTVNIMVIEFHNEVKHPKRNFWRGMALAFFVIISVYVLYGAFVYSQQGQFCVNPANQGMSIYAWQTAINAINLVIGCVASVLYANIGLKVLYFYLVHKVFKGPEMVTRRGRMLWIGMSTVYYIIAFIVAAAVPQLNNISGFFGAIALVPFTYTLPPLLMTIFRIKLNAFNNGVANKFTSAEWWKKAVFPRWYLNVFELGIAIASLSVIALGAWSTIDSMVQAFKAGAPPPFSCTSPFS